MQQNAEELEVLNIAPSTRAVWRLRRLTARARGRPRLAVRRIAAAAAIAARNASSEVISDDDQSAPRPQKRRRKFQKKTQIQTLSKELQIAQTVGAQFALEKAQCEAELADEKHKNMQLRASQQALERKLAGQASQLKGLVAEQKQLRQRIQELQRTPQGNRGPAVTSQQAFVKQIVEMECRPLRDKSPQTRLQLKKKLLVKWHPDKQPSAEHASVATCVMQEMQNRSEWKQ